jgi:alpha-tubulin suppressor-like RCC1 family protein
MGSAQLAGTLALCLFAVGACTSPRAGSAGDDGKAGSDGPGSWADAIPGGSGGTADAGQSSRGDAGQSSAGDAAGGVGGPQAATDARDDRAGADAPAVDMGPPPECRARTDCPASKLCAGGRCQLGAVDIVTGSAHSCALLSDGTVRCWGDNEFGQLGTGALDDQATPVPVVGLANVERLFGGRHTTCATIAQGGGTFCWGPPVLGSTSSSPPDRLPVSVPALSGIIDLVLRSGSACALFGDGPVHCWGNNGYGQVGNGRVEELIHVDQPSPVVDLSGATALSGGFGFFCALSGGAVWCWGINTVGQLGDGTTRNSPRPLRVPSLPTATAVASGESHTCALVNGPGPVRCWGMGTEAQLGDGTTRDSAVPVAAMGVNGVGTVAAGGSATCATLTDGSVRCWGTHRGILGGMALSPREVPGLSGLRNLAFNVSHGCAVMSDGTVRCMGSNSNGQLGIGNFGMPPPATPTPVAPW